MVELSIFVVLVLFLWKFRKPIQFWAETNTDKAEVWAVSQKADMQEDLAELDTKVDAIKAANNNKWFTLNGIESKMN